MSIRKQIIEIEPGVGISREAFATAPVKCPACKGRGGFSRFWPPGEEWEVCGNCGGSGELVAIVTIDWKPNKE